jgi:hypothetical protein
MNQFFLDNQPDKAIPFYVVTIQTDLASRYETMHKGSNYRIDGQFIAPEQPIEALADTLSSD